MNVVNLTIRQLRLHYRNGDFTPAELVDFLLNKASSLMDDNAWITLFSTEHVQLYLDQLSLRSLEEFPLYGVPFAIKDNIDLAGIPTTAACREFAYTPDRSAFVVQRLIDAGAIPLGKTNLDQFATGLVGTRSPYGATRNAFDPEYISGGSSSGSAVVVAQGLVSFSLGTDTAGSGRIPAAFNNILGLKTSRGLMSNSGVVPACKSLDCVAYFATTTDDLETVFNLTAAHDADDPYSRHNPQSNRISYATPPQFRFAVPRNDQMAFFGNDAFQQLFHDSVARLEGLGGTRVTVDFSAFLRAAALLYQGPWVTERYLACKSILESDPDALLPVTRAIIAPGKDHSAAALFSAQYQLHALKQLTDPLMRSVDFLLTPTAGTVYTHEDIAREPITLNSNLGYYTNYMNLLDYAAIAVPGGFTHAGIPFGVTLISEAFSDHRLLAWANRLQQDIALPLGATQWPLPPNEAQVEATTQEINLVVCGAHMSGLPLNFQLQNRQATFVKKCRTSPHYKMLALPGGPPDRPGIIRNEKSGTALEVEVWRIPGENLGSFLAGIPHPLGLGKIQLDDSQWETGFICEGYVEKNATDISKHGGWRNYLDSR